MLEGNESAVADTIYYRRADGTAVSELDTLMPGEHLLVLTGGRRFQVAGITRDVILSLREEPLDLPQVAENLKERGVGCETDRLQQILLGLEKLAVVSTNKTSTTITQRKRREFQDYMTFKVPLLRASRIAPLTQRMGLLYSEKWMFWLMPALLLWQIFFCFAYQSRLLHAIPTLSAAGWTLLLAGNYCALLLHELGHASACSAKGINHGPIGFCIYLIYPAFYADVSDIWKLPRRQRAVVDGAGIYMSLLCALGFSAAFFISGRPACGVLAILCDITVFFNLNPFIRMDGYWLVSDWLGVQNLMAINREVSWWAIRKMLGRRVARHAILSKEYKLRWFYVCYFFGFVLFFVYLTLEMGRRYIPELVAAYPEICWRLRAALVHPNGAGAIRDLFAWLISTVTMLGLVLLLVRLFRSSVAYFKLLVRSGRQADNEAVC